jgi:hypothetical protein
MITVNNRIPYPKGWNIIPDNNMHRNTIPLIVRVTKLFTAYSYSIDFGDLGESDSLFSF